MMNVGDICIYNIKPYWHNALEETANLFSSHKLLKCETPEQLESLFCVLDKAGLRWSHGEKLLPIGRQWYVRLPLFIGKQQVNKHYPDDFVISSTGGICLLVKDSKHI